MNVSTQLKLCLCDQTQVIANAACRVGSHQFRSYLFPYFLLQSLLPIYIFECLVCIRTMVLYNMALKLSLYLNNTVKN